jgi:hypothetical protein
VSLDISADGPSGSTVTLTRNAKKPANVVSVVSERARGEPWKAVFFFRSRLTLPGRVKAGPQIESWQGRSAAALTPAVILFIALPEVKDNIDPG